MNQISFYDEYIKCGTFEDASELRGTKVYNTKNAIDTLYSDIYRKKEEWEKEKPCKCGHKRVWHLMISKQCLDCKACKKYRQVPLFEYTYGVFTQSKIRSWFSL